MSNVYWLNYETDGMSLRSDIVILEKHFAFISLNPWIRARGEGEKRNKTPKQPTSVQIKYGSALQQNSL